MFTITTLCNYAILKLGKVILEKESWLLSRIARSSNTDLKHMCLTTWEWDWMRRINQLLFSKIAYTTFKIECVVVNFYNALDCKPRCNCAHILTLDQWTFILQKSFWECQLSAECSLLSGHGVFLSSALKCPLKQQQLPIRQLSFAPFTVLSGFFHWLLVSLRAQVQVHSFVTSAPG